MYLYPILLTGLLSLSPLFILASATLEGSAANYIASYRDEPRGLAVKGVEKFSWEVEGSVMPPSRDLLIKRQTRKPTTARTTRAVSKTSSARRSSATKVSSETRMPTRTSAIRATSTRASASTRKSSRASASSSTGADRPLATAVGKIIDNKDEATHLTPKDERYCSTEQACTITQIIDPKNPKKCVTCKGNTFPDARQEKCISATP